MKLRIAILGIGLLAGAAALNAQTRPTYVGSSTQGGQTATSGPIKVSYVSQSDGQDANDQSITRPTFVDFVAQDGQQAPSTDFDIAVFPIPAVDVLNVEIVNAIPDEFIRVTLYDSQGNRVPAHQERSGYLFQFEVFNLAPGRYQVQVVTNTQEETRTIEIL